MLNMIEKDPNGRIQALMLTDEMLYLTTLYLAKHYLSVTDLGVKTRTLNDARKTLYKAVIYLEEVVTNYIDALPNTKTR